jgi:hypothetical protein
MKESGDPVTGTANFSQWDKEGSPVTIKLGYERHQVREKTARSIEKGL